MKKFAMASAIGLTIGLLASAPAAEAGDIDDGRIVVNYSVQGGHDPVPVGDALTFELFDELGSVVPGCSLLSSGVIRTCIYGEATSSLVSDSSYAVGVGDLDEAYEVTDVRCSGAQTGSPALPPSGAGIDGSVFSAAIIDFGSLDQIACTVTIKPKDNGVRIKYQVTGGDDPDAAGAALEFHLFEEGGAAAEPCVEQGSGAVRSCLYEDSVAGPGTYVLGVANIDNAYWLRALGCGGAVVADRADREARAVGVNEVNFKVFGNAYFSYRDGQPVECTLFLRAKPNVYIDNVVDNSAAAPGTATLSANDFAIEIYDDDGMLVSTGAITDPDDAQCSSALQSDAVCASVNLADGDFTMGAVPLDYGYELIGLDCTVLGDAGDARAALPSPDFDFSHSNSSGNEETRCTLTHEYVSQTVTADLVVTNDSGRTAAGDEFTIQVFDVSGNVVASGVDPEPGTGNASAEFVLPIGPYTFGVDGPEGYEASASIMPRGVDQLAISTGADFTLTRTQGATGVIGVDDLIIPPTTTTATTTTTITTTTTVALATATTTVALTTTAPTTTPTVVLPATPEATVAPTSNDAPTSTITSLLPATGSSSSQTLSMLLIALALMVLGGGAVVATRR